MRRNPRLFQDDVSDRLRNLGIPVVPREPAWLDPAIQAHVLELGPSVEIAEFADGIIMVSTSDGHAWKLRDVFTDLDEAVDVAGGYYQRAARTRPAFAQNAHAPGRGNFSDRATAARRAPRRTRNADSFAEEFKKAFERIDLDSGRNNHATLAAMRREIAAYSREEFDLGLNDLRRQRLFTLDSADGRHVKLSEEVRDAGIRERGALLVYVAKIQRSNSSHYVLRDEAGSFWAYRVKKDGVVSKAGHRITSEEADRMVATGEADFEKPRAARAREPSATEIRESYERDVQDKADRGVQIQPRDWSAAMNRDDEVFFDEPARRRNGEARRPTNSSQDDRSNEDIVLRAVENAPERSSLGEKWIVDVWEGTNLSLPEVAASLRQLMIDRKLNLSGDDSANMVKYGNERKEQQHMLEGEIMIAVNPRHYVRLVVPRTRNGETPRQKFKIGDHVRDKHAADRVGVVSHSTGRYDDLKREYTYKVIDEHGGRHTWSERSMVATKLPLFTMDGHEDTFTVGEFIYNNKDAPLSEADYRRIRRLGVGKSVRFGGGAMAQAIVKRVS